MAIKLSIIVAVYNMSADGVLAYCMNSLLQQDLDEEYEVIAVDDCSTDASLEVLHKLQKKYPNRLVVLSTPENLRQGGARNLGLEAARGEWVGFIDSDDWYHPTAYRRMLAMAEETGADLVGCQYVMTSVQSMVVPEWQAPVMRTQTGEMDDERRGNMILQGGSMMTKIYRRSVIEEFHLRFPEKMFYEDNVAAPLWYLRFRHYERIDEPLYYYYQRPASTVHTVSIPRLRNRMEAGLRLLEAFRDNGYYETYHAQLMQVFTRIYYVNTLFSYLQSCKWIRIGLLRELRKTMLREFPNFQESEYFAEEYDAEQKKMIAMHMKHPVRFLLYDRLLRVYRRLRYGKR